MPFKSLHRNMERIACLKPGELIKVSSPKCYMQVLLKLYLPCQEEEQTLVDAAFTQKEEIVKISWD